MSSETTDFLNDLDRVVEARTAIADALLAMTATLEKAETESDRFSGRLELDTEMADLRRVEDTLRKGSFRLLVLGDMKRGKSTFLNALLGENLLPSDVNPCTAILTILRYGEEKKVTVHFTDETPPQAIDFKSFKREYTIDPAEAKRLETENKQAFPNVAYAIVEYPLPLLEKGIEIIDSPGLNDTEARNELSLGYLANCHAVLFVMRASQPCTLSERRYLENYIKDRGLSVFFLINAWDQVKESLIDPDDPEELEEAEWKLKRVFRANLEEYCQVEGADLYDERVFEISALQALRRRLSDADVSLGGTGFPRFLASLNTFLTRERAIAQLRQARTLSRQTSNRVREGVERRIPLLGQDLEQLRHSIDEVAPEFEKLTEIRDRFQAEIRATRDRKSEQIADSFRDYVLGLGDTFESDFGRYQPDMNFFTFLSAGNREAFENGLRTAFEQYVNDKLTEWTRKAEKEMDAAFAHLSNLAASYGASYARVSEAIDRKLTGQSIPKLSGFAEDDNAPAWAKWAAGVFSLARGNVAGVAMAGAGFDWKNIILNLITVWGVSQLITVATGAVLGPIGLAIVGLGVGLVQADGARQQLVKAAKKELVGYLPQVANEQRPIVRDAIAECFNSYEKEVSDRIDSDINSRTAELENLVKQKESREVDLDAELARLRALEGDIETSDRRVEQAYQGFIAACE